MNAFEVGWVAGQGLIESTTDRFGSRLPHWVLANPYMARKA